MPTDKPSFLRGTDDNDTEEQEVMSVLEDESKTPTTETAEKTEDAGTSPQAGNTTKDTEEETPTDDAKETGEDGTQAKDDEGKKNDGDTGKPVDEDAKKIENVKKKYKTTEEIEKANLELTRALSKLTEENKKLKDGATKPDTTQPSMLDNLKGTQVINPQIPKAENYLLSDGTLDLNSYMRDYTKSLTMTIQQSLLGGPLAAGMFSILQKAIGEEHAQTIDERNRMEQAETIWDQVKEKYPILSDKKELEDLYAKAIYGEKYRRAVEAQQAGKEPEELSAEDYMNLARDLVAGRTIETTPTVEDKTETIKGQTVMSEGGSALSEEDKAIEGMMALKTRQLF